MVSNNDGKKQCTNCKCWRLEEDFIGKKSAVVKRCLKCRNKEARRVLKPKVKEVRNARQREKKYYIKYREKKREENEEEYLKHNAEIAKNWRRNNKDHLSKWQTKNFKARFNGIKQQAKKKGYEWNTDMTDEYCKILMENNCFYCGFLSEKTLNGIDRMDNNIGYKKDNCVSCCKNCNFIKKSLDPLTFIQRCEHITFIHYGLGELHNDIWRNCNSSSYKSYKYRAW